MPPARGLRHGRRQGDDGRPPAGALRDPYGRPGLARRPRREPELLASCHRRSLELAAGLGCRTIAFPAVSTGVYGYPVELAAEVAIASTRSALEELRELELVRFVLFGEAAEAAFAAALTAPDRLGDRAHVLRRGAAAAADDARARLDVTRAACAELLGA